VTDTFEKVTDTFGEGTKRDYSRRKSHKEHEGGEEHKVVF
jgi:hypothetical protein